MEVFKKRLRFGDHDDLTLLREVLGQNPFENPALWDVIQENVFSVTAKKFTVRSLKEHLERLIKIWLEQTKLLIGKSGIEEQATEKDTLCRNIYEIMQEFSKEKRAKKTGNKQQQKLNKEKGEDARNKWVSKMDRQQPLEHIGSMRQDHSYSADCEIVIDFEDNKDMTQEEVILNIENGSDHNETIMEPERLNFKENVPPQQASSTPKNSRGILGPIRSRKRKVNTQRQGLAYLEEYDKQQREIKKRDFAITERKLALEERRMVLEERKFNLSEFETKEKLRLQEKKIDFEIEERRELTKIIERQDKLLNLILNKSS